MSTLSPQTAASDAARPGASGGASARPAARRVLHALRDAPDPLTAQQIADIVELHHSGVRLQLAALVRAGILEARTDAPCGRGRPATRYAPVPDVAADVAQHHLGLVRLVGTLARDVGFDSDDVERFGRGHGHSITHPDGGPDELRRTFTRLGFTPRRIEERPGCLALGRCPVIDDVERPGGHLICALHRGIARGIASQVGLPQAEIEAGTPRGDGCVMRLGSDAAVHAP